MEIKEVKGIIGHECTHAGQHGAYTDSTYEYNIETENGKEIPQEDLLPYCFSLVGRNKCQTRQEWSAGHSNPNIYFSGYYELTKNPTGYKFKFVLPYVD